MSSPNKHLWQSEPFTFKHSLQLLFVTRIHRYIPFIDKHTKPLQNHSSFVTIFISLSNSPQTCIIQNNPILTTR
ncbi:hypothetical protein HanRHA438_Chr13g0584541 [Helianthus annuus]|nr:hypothetical protein HanRHA438_Chr13g0584541 [Helianthus annuus]